MKIGILGCGTIGSLLESHFTHNGHEVMTCTRTSAASAADLVQQTDTIFLCVKPQQAKAVAEATASLWSKEHLLVSVMTGTPLQRLKELFAPARLMRIMPNTPMRIGKGVIGLVESDTYTDQDKTDIDALLQGLGSLHWIEEKQLDALTAVAGSGPGYLFLILEAMTDAGVRAGLPAPLSRTLAAEAMEGTAALAVRESQGLSDLRLQVCSPGGTTICGLKEMEDLGVRSGVMNGVLAAYARSLELNRS